MKITSRHWYLRSLELKSARIARDLIKGEEVDAAIKAATVSSKNRVKRKKKKCVLAQQLNTTLYRKVYVFVHDNYPWVLDIPNPFATPTPIIARQPPIRGLQAPNQMGRAN